MIAIEKDFKIEQKLAQTILCLPLDIRKKGCNFEFCILVNNRRNLVLKIKEPWK